MTIVRTADNGEATFTELGVSRQRVGEWRKLRDAGNTEPRWLPA